MSKETKAKPIEVQRLREYLATSQQWEDSSIVIISSQDIDYQDPPKLLLVHFLSSNSFKKTLLKELIELAKGNRAMKSAHFRHRLPSDLGSLLTNHLLEVQRIFLPPKDTVVEETARRYLDLVSWGEPNSAKVLAEEGEVPLRTIHSRLMNARKKGLLDSPGIGFRFST